ncbi:MAG: ribonuclease III [Candidatus Eisenbacteria bacterium]|uniref:Ribonuclease 3 n=1 Tax=Eiseniibacteriota bacterium TaxID=2212470 RepID=A0A956SD76_UNCEI|nr:ribonuclease III [Candidatus Eisenbacteria bacterium]
MDSWLAKVRALFAGVLSDEPDAFPQESDSNQGRLEAFQRDLEVRFVDIALLEQALTHRSYLGSCGGDPALSNERMEFLGDAVLELIVIEYLYRVHPEDREGALTKRKGLLVSRKVLASSAEWMKLGDYVLLSEAERESGGSARSSILADTFEAVVGAIYLDQGLEAARRFVRDRLLVHANRIFQDLSRANFKSQLQEYVQASYKTHPRYRVVTEVGPDHRKLFTVEVNVRGQLLGRGQGYNKKEAQQSAARNAILRLERDAARTGGQLPSALAETSYEPAEAPSAHEFTAAELEQVGTPESEPTHTRDVPFSASLRRSASPVETAVERDPIPDGLESQS